MNGRSSSYLVFDIETVVDPALPQEGLGDGLPPAPFHQVVVLGVLCSMPTIGSSVWGSWARAGRA